MSPFTLFYNKQEIIELAKLNERLYVASPDRLVFKRYSKVEANLERTLLKVSFNDVQILKGIFDRMFHMLNQEYLRLVEEHGNLDSPSQVKELSFFEKQLIKETKQKSSIA